MFDTIYMRCGEFASPPSISHFPEHSLHHTAFHSVVKVEIPRFFQMIRKIQPGNPVVPMNSQKDAGIQRCGSFWRYVHCSCQQRRQHCS